MKILSAMFLLVMVVVGCGSRQVEQPSAAPEAAPDVQTIEVEADPMAQAIEDPDA